MNPSSKERLRNLGTGRIVNEYTRNLLRKANTGKKLTEKAKDKIRKARLKQIIPVKDTKIEVIFQKALDNLKIDYKKHVELKGQPDIFISPNVCIFLDGCYWHGCKSCNLDKNKIVTLGRRKRDKNVTSTLKSQGYTVLRFREHDINRNIDYCVNNVINTLGHANGNK